MQTITSQSPHIPSQSADWPGARILFILLLCAGFAYAAFCFYLMFHTVFG